MPSHTAIERQKLNQRRRGLKLPSEVSRLQGLFGKIDPTTGKNVNIGTIAKTVLSLGQPRTIPSPGELRGQPIGAPVPRRSILPQPVLSLPVQRPGPVVPPERRSILGTPGRGASRNRLNAVVRSGNF